MSEIWKDVKGYEGIYQISNLGRIKAFKKTINKGKCHRSWKEHFNNYGLDTFGYYRVSLSKNGITKTFKVHRLVAEAFISNPKNKSQVNHINGIKTCNEVSNLEWVTPNENMKHACENKLKLLNGENNPAAKLTYQDVCFIRENYIPRDPLYGTVALSKKFGVHRKTISRIINFKHWKEGDADVKNKSL